MPDEYATVFPGPFLIYQNRISSTRYCCVEKSYYVQSCNVPNDNNIRSIVFPLTFGAGS